MPPKLVNAAKLLGFMGAVGMGLKLLSPYIIKTDEALPNAIHQYPYMAAHVRDMELFLVLQELLMHHPRLSKLCQNLLHWFHKLAAMELQDGKACNYTAQLLRHNLQEGFVVLETYPYPIYSMYQEVKEITEELRESVDDLCHNINIDVLSGNSD